MNKNGQVNLLISPVYLKQWLETSKETLYFVESSINNALYDLFLIGVQLVLSDPCKWVKVLIIDGFPYITNNVIPLFQGLSIWLQVFVLAPSLEVLNAFKTFLEAKSNAVGVFFGTWCHLEPEVCNPGND